MTEKVKKATTTAKARKTAAAAPAMKRAPKTKSMPIAMPSPTMPSHEEIARLAYKYWEQRGYPHGTAEQDWFCAEQDLLQKAS